MIIRSCNATTRRHPMTRRYFVRRGDSEEHRFAKRMFRSLFQWFQTFR